MRIDSTKGYRASISVRSPGFAGVYLASELSDAVSDSAQSVVVIEVADGGSKVLMEWVRALRKILCLA